MGHSRTKARPRISTSIDVRNKNDAEGEMKHRLGTISTSARAKQRPGNHQFYNSQISVRIVKRIMITITNATFLVIDVVQIRISKHKIRSRSSHTNTLRNAKRNLARSLLRIPRRRRRTAAEVKSGHMYRLI